MISSNWKKKKEINIDYSLQIGETGLTFLQLMTAIVMFFLKTKATIQQIDFILSLIQVLCPSNSNFPSTWHTFYKIVKNNSPEIVQVVVCPNLCMKVSPSLNIGDRDVCFQCNTPLYLGKAPKKFYYSIPLSLQLVTIFKNRPKLLQQMAEYSQKMLKYPENCIGDFQQGDWMKSNISFMVYRWNLALGICIDGIPTYASSKVSLWPVYCIILNLPPNIRYKIENILLVSCSTSPRLPEEYNVICSHLISELTILHHGIPVVNSIDQHHTLLKARLCFLTSDLEAKNKILNMTGYNGYYGCYFCNIKGTYDSQHVYFPGRPGIERTNPELVHDAKSKSHGVKALSQLYQLHAIYDNFQTLQSCPIDIMHNIFLGVTKKITKFWINNSSSSSEFGMKDQLPALEDFAQSISSSQKKNQ